MNTKFLTIIFSAIALNGCTEAYLYPEGNPNEELRTAAINVARVYAYETGYYYEKNGADKTIAAAQQVVRGALKDPESATFRNLRLVYFGEGNVVCGEVNGKNSYGGYVGYKSFVAGISGVTIEATTGKFQEINDSANAGILEACRN